MTKQLNDNLSDEQKDVLFNAGTEPPFSGALLKNKENGMYSCANCRAELFDSTAKYDTSTLGLSGWPSFDASLPDTIEERDDYSFGMNRREIVCANCGGHLGHVFPDDEASTGTHFCVNSLSLDFKPEKD